MKNKKGTFELSYNTQITVDHKLGIIVANDVSQDRIDTYQLKP
jgi:transposase